jgi:hypothetical protein
LLVTARTCTRRVLPVRVATPIDANEVWRATGTPARRSESRSESTPAVNGARAPNATSPPRRARDCPRTDRVTFPANESIATSAATPSEIDDM